MAGFRILAIILAIICLASALGLFFPNDFRAVKVREVVLRQSDVLIKLRESDPVLKSYLKYMVAGSAVITFGLGLLFLISAFSPLVMRPFIVVVIITSLIWIPLAVWQGTLFGVSKAWMIADVLRCLILAVLLYVFFPRREKPSPSSEAENLSE